MVVITRLPCQAPVVLEFQNLSYAVPDMEANSLRRFSPYMTKEKKTILKNVSGIFKPGELSAIMGPSGSGKTTLMNILAGYRNENVEGTMYVNGKPRDLSQFRRMSCYVMQDDVHLPHLTVLESMRYAAELMLPRSTSSGQRDALIMQIFDTIGLTECKDVRASNISGGQRKRLSIALELIKKPPIILLDEPSSGLDSASCVSCIALLKSLALGGRTVVATIHQPSAKILEQFDTLYLLAQGKNLYSGPTSSIVSFFSNYGLQCPEYHNPADFAIEVAIGDYGEQWIDILAKATGDLESSKSLQAPNNNFSDQISHGLEVFEGQLSPLLFSDRLKTTCLSNCGQLFSTFWTLLRRSTLCVGRDMILTHLRFASTIFVGLLVGTLYHDVGNDASKCFHNTGNLFFGLLFMIFSAMMTTILTFPLERGVLVREHLNCWYSLKLYYMARTLADLPFQLFFPLFYILFMYFMTEQPLETFRFFIVLGIGTLVSLVAQTIGLLIGAACTVESAVFLGPVTAIPFFLFSGCFMTLSTIPAFLRWISWISYVRYAFQSIVTAIYGLNRGQLKCMEEYCHFKNPKKFLEMMGIIDIPVGNYALYLVVMLIILRFVSYWALRWKIKSVIK